MNKIIATEWYQESIEIWNKHVFCKLHAIDGYRLKKKQSFSQYDCIKSIKFEPVLEMTGIKMALCPHMNYSVNAALSEINVISHQNDGMKDFESQWQNKPITPEVPLW